jgi:lipopolysaccharide transport system ATP-binding protein
LSREAIIKVEGLSKKYLLAKNTAVKSDTLYGNILNGVKNLKNIAQKKNTEEFLALDDVSFEVEQGDRVGIIGRNGAGKSTLLKIISRITPPTKGRIEINGRLASLLEVGTGFHGDLSGRENIYLNGSILGMTKREIDAKFDEIIDFAEVEKFLDTPVKRYSSGMYVRLAFAVAAHLEPDILIVDEVLAVGDSAFQKKCIGKMNDVSTKEGRTILFVSHNMAALQNLCNKAIVLNKGKVVLPLTASDSAIKYYLNDVKSNAQFNLDERTDRQGEGKIKLRQVEFLDAESNVQQSLISGQSVKMKINYTCYDNINPENVTVAIAISGDDGVLYSVLGNEFSSAAFDSISQAGSFICSIKKFPLLQGNYLLNVSVSQNGIVQDWVQEAVNLEVENGDFYGTGKIVPTTHRSVLVENNWECKPS